MIDINMLVSKERVCKKTLKMVDKIVVTTPRTTFAMNHLEMTRKSGFRPVAVLGFSPLIKMREDIFYSVLPYAGRRSKHVRYLGSPSIERSTISHKLEI